MLEFDELYFKNISDFINSRDGIKYKIAQLTDDPEKLIFHLKYYIDTRSVNQLHIEFNDDFTVVRVLEFFECIILDYGQVVYTRKDVDKFFVPVKKENKQLNPEVTPPVPVATGTKTKPIVQKTIFD